MRIFLIKFHKHDSVHFMKNPLRRTQNRWDRPEPRRAAFRESLRRELRTITSAISIKFKFEIQFVTFLRGPLGHRLVPHRYYSPASIAPGVMLERTPWLRTVFLCKKSKFSFPGHKKCKNIYFATCDPLPDKSASRQYRRDDMKLNKNIFKYSKRLRNSPR